MPLDSLPSRSADHQCDVLVIGGGPAGSTTATLLAEKGHQVMKHGSKEFSWFIYRVTNPTMHDPFMSPSNVFRVKEALLSVLAGDIFGKTPIWHSLHVFKTIYYPSLLANLKRTVMAWKRRRVNIQYIEDADEVACR